MTRWIVPLVLAGAACQSPTTDGAAVMHLEGLRAGLLQGVSFHLEILNREEDKARVGDGVGMVEELPNESYTFTIPFSGVPQNTELEFNLSLRLESPDFVLFDAQVITSVSEADPEVRFGDNNIKTRYDQDGDGHTSFYELLVGTDPDDGSDHPPGPYCVNSSGCGGDMCSTLGSCMTGCMPDGNYDPVAEECDGNQFGGYRTCETLGLAPGTLRCNSDCTIDTTGCGCAGLGVGCSSSQECCAGLRCDDSTCQLEVEAAVDASAELNGLGFNDVYITGDDTRKVFVAATVPLGGGALFVLDGGTWISQCEPEIMNAIDGDGIDAIAVGAAGWVRVWVDPNDMWSDSTPEPMLANLVDVVAISNGEWVALGESGELHHWNGSWTSHTPPAVALAIARDPNSGQIYGVGAAGVLYSCPSGDLPGCGTLSGVGTGQAAAVLDDNSLFVAGDSANMVLCPMPGSCTGAMTGLGTSPMVNLTGVWTDGAAVWVAGTTTALEGWVYGFLPTSGSTPWVPQLFTDMPLSAIHGAVDTLGRVHLTAVGANGVVIHIVDRTLM